MNEEIKSFTKLVHQYLRHKKKFPHVWCPGCGHGIILSGILRAIHKLKLSKDEIVMISGIGCSGRTPTYVDFNTLHTTHGRALAFATGVKLAEPRFKVIAVMGDGDSCAIGGNHLIHAARRNIDITAIIYNNYIYGMTGGQVSPTTPFSAIASTARYGNIDQPFDICDLVRAAGATFVARSTVYHVPQMENFIKKAIVKKGFSVVEIMTPCYTAFGRLNKLKSPVEMMKWLRDSAVSIEKANQMSEDELKGKIITGIFIDRDDREEYCTLYEKICEKAGGLNGS